MKRKRKAEARMAVAGRRAPAEDGGAWGSGGERASRQRAEELRRKQLERTATLLDLYDRAPELTDKEIFDRALEEAVCLTDSAIGYLHQVNDDQARSV